MCDVLPMHHPVRNPVCNCEVDKLAHWHTHSKAGSIHCTGISLAQQMEYLFHSIGTPEQKGRMYVDSSARYQAGIELCEHMLDSVLECVV